MTEQYTGPRFRTIFVQCKTPKHHSIEELAKYVAEFQARGFTPSHETGTAGNMSIRVASEKQEFIITAAGLKSKQNLCAADFVLVHQVDFSELLVHVTGERQPSSETLMHYLIYKTFPQINAVFHGHWQWLLDNYHLFHFPVIEKPFPYGTVELAQQVVQALMNNSPVVIIHSHGFVSAGKTMKEAASSIIQIGEY